MAKTLLERYGRISNCGVLHLLETDGSPKVAKPPTEVDRIRNAQKQETIMLKKRQASDLLNAQSRELQKQAREKMANANKPKPASH